MGAVTSLIDAALFIFFLVIALAAPLMDFQILLPRHFYPDVLLNFKAWYTQHYGDYLFLEKPHFFVAIIWLELFLQWPLSLFSLYGIASGKSWVNTTCLIFGSSTLTNMVAILSDMVWSGKASEKLMMVYVPFLGFAVLAILRGLLSQPGRTTVIGKRPVLNRKKRA